MNIIKYLLLLITLFLVQFSNAQTVRTDVAVFGATESGLAAAIQAAHSNVKTLFVVEGNDLITNISEDTDTSYNAGVKETLMKLILKARTDSVSGVVSPYSAAIVSQVLKGWTDTIKNLTIIRNMGWSKLKKSGKGWDVKLKNGRTVKSHVLVDATLNSTLAAKAGIPYDPATGYYRTLTPLAQTDVKQTYSNHIYRTSVGIVKTAQYGPVMIPLGSIIAFGTDNFILAGKSPVFKAPKQFENASMPVGQAAGAAAAYCAFFQTTTSKLHVRITQGELIAYKSWLVPFDDIKREDSNFVALQHVGATGLLKGRIVDGKLMFQPDSLVAGEDIRAVMKEFYSRSQIWFADNKKDTLTLDDVLQLIKFSASRGDELNGEVERGWKSSFKFVGQYDPAHFITRREFAVLANSYLKPFNVRVDMRGNLGN